MNFYGIEQAKSLFNDSFSQYSYLMTEKYPDEKPRIISDTESSLRLVIKERQKERRPENY